jgi:hypothetical protein
LLTTFSEAPTEQERSGTKGFSDLPKISSLPETSFEHWKPPPIKADEKLAIIAQDYKMPVRKEGVYLTKSAGDQRLSNNSKAVRDCKSRANSMSNAMEAANYAQRETIRGEIHTESLPPSTDDIYKRSWPPKAEVGTRIDDYDVKGLPTDSHDQPEAKVHQPADRLSSPDGAKQGLRRASQIDGDVDDFNDDAATGRRVGGYISRYYGKFPEGTRKKRKKDHAILAAATKRNAAETVSLIDRQIQHDTRQKAEAKNDRSFRSEEAARNLRTAMAMAIDSKGLAEIHVETSTKKGQSFAVAALHAAWEETNTKKEQIASMGAASTAAKRDGEETNVKEGQRLSATATYIAARRDRAESDTKKEQIGSIGVPYTAAKRDGEEANIKTGQRPSAAVAVRSDSGEIDTKNAQAALQIVARRNVAETMSLIDRLIMQEAAQRAEAKRVKEAQRAENPTVWRRLLSRGAAKDQRGSV